MKKNIARIIVSAIVLVLALILKNINECFQIALYVISYLIIAYDVIIDAFKSIIKGKVFNEKFLMSVATIGAFAIREYPEAVAVMLFYQVGELFQDIAVGRSRKSIKSLLELRPDFANLKTANGIEVVDPTIIKVGDIILIKPGERVPLDGIIIEGESYLDTSALTGESVPRLASVTSEIYSGSINTTGLLTVQVTKNSEDSTISKMLELVESATDKKAKTERFITKFATVYTPIVVLIALILAIIPPLVIPEATFNDWIYRALSFLVVSCPCAFVVSVPISFFGGIGGAAKRGILIKGSNYFEVLAKTKTVVFDKTGTLTKGEFKIQKIKPVSVSKEELLGIVALAEYNSKHPIAYAIFNEYKEVIDEKRITDFTQLSGLGITLKIDGQIVHAGNKKLFDQNGIKVSNDEQNIVGTIIYVAKNNEYLGYILIADKIKDDAKIAITQLKEIGIINTYMLTGDNKQVGENVAKEVGIDHVFTDLLPANKVEALEKILDNKDNHNVAFVGDGINDAPALARSDIGIAMGGIGSDAAIESADVVIMADQPSKIKTAIKIAKKTIMIARQNIYLSIGIKVIVLILAAFNITNMWMAVVADVGVTIVAILNSFRALNTKKL